MSNKKDHCKCGGLFLIDAEVDSPERTHLTQPEDCRTLVRVLVAQTHTGCRVQIAPTLVQVLVEWVLVQETTDGWVAARIGPTLTVQRIAILLHYETSRTVLLG